MKPSCVELNKTNTPLNIRRCRPLLGTFVEIQVPVSVSDADEKKMGALISQAFTVIKRVEETLSRFNPHGDIGRLNLSKKAGDFLVSPMAFRVLSAAQSFAEKTQGAFFFSKKPLKLKSGNGVRLLYPNPEIDLGGIAKGFAVDQAVGFLRRRGVESALVNAGGDMRAFGPVSWPVSVRNPKSPQEEGFSLILKNASLCNSGDYFQPGHIVKNRRVPNRPTIAAGAMAKTCMRADALTKLLMVQGMPGLKSLRAFQACGYTIDATGRVNFDDRGKLSFSTP